MNLCSNRCYITSHQYAFHTQTHKRMEWIEILVYHIIRNGGMRDKIAVDVEMNKKSLRMKI